MRDTPHSYCINAYTAVTKPVPLPMLCRAIILNLNEDLCIVESKTSESNPTIMQALINTASD